jgi:diaminopimelate decarboxylase
MKLIGERVYAMFQSYHEKTNRKITLEIEPGTFYVANAGHIACDVIDLVDTGKGGYHFARLNTGMDMIVRPTMYGSQHPIMIAKKLKSEEANMVEDEEYNIHNTILPNEE